MWECVTKWNQYDCMRSLGCAWCTSPTYQCLPLPFEALGDKLLDTNGSSVYFSVDGSAECTTVLEAGSDPYPETHPFLMIWELLTFSPSAVMNYIPLFASTSPLTAVIEVVMVVLSMFSFLNLGFILQCIPVWGSLALSLSPSRGRSSLLSFGFVVPLTIAVCSVGVSILDVASCSTDELSAAMIYMLVMSVLILCLLLRLHVQWADAKLAALNPEKIPVYCPTGEPALLGTRGLPLSLRKRAANVYSAVMAAEVLGFWMFRAFSASTSLIGILNFLAIDLFIKLWLYLPYTWRRWPLVQTAGLFVALDLFDRLAYETFGLSDMSHQRPRLDRLLAGELPLPEIFVPLGVVCVLSTAFLFRQLSKSKTRFQVSKQK